MDVVPLGEEGGLTRWTLDVTLDTTLLVGTTPALGTQESLVVGGALGVVACPRWTRDCVDGDIGDSNHVVVTR